FIHPLTILSALPFAGFGALLTLLVFKVDLSIYAFVGIIMLVGLVKKNGIMMVDFAIEEQKKGLTAEQAIFDACIVRFRPMMMTRLRARGGRASNFSRTILDGRSARSPDSSVDGVDAVV